MSQPFWAGPAPRYPSLPSPKSWKSYLITFWLLEFQPALLAQLQAYFHSHRDWKLASCFFKKVKSSVLKKWNPAADAIFSTFSLLLRTKHRLLIVQVKVKSNYCGRGALCEYTSTKSEGRNCAFPKNAGPPSQKPDHSGGNRLNIWCFLSCKEAERLQSGHREAVNLSCL